MPPRLPGVVFEAGNCLIRSLPVDRGSRDRFDYQLRGRIEDGTIFLLHYSSAVTTWECDRHLGPALRRKILKLLRTEVRFAKSPPTYLRTHDLRDADKQDLNESTTVAERITREFRNEFLTRQSG